MTPMARRRQDVTRRSGVEDPLSGLARIGREVAMRAALTAASEALRAGRSNAGKANSLRRGG
jgi:hypothetical protein